MHLPAVGLVDHRTHALEAALQPLEAFAKALLAGKLQDGARRAVMFVADQCEEPLGRGAVSDEFGILFRDVHVSQVERLLHFVHRQSEAARAIEHVTQECHSLAAARNQEVIEGIAKAIPAGEQMAVLAPGEDPGNGAQVADALGAEAPCGA